MSEEHLKGGFAIGFDLGGNPEIHFKRFIVSMGNAGFSVRLTDPLMHLYKLMFDELDAVHQAIVFEESSKKPAK
jgi:hypothetical protein